MLLLPIGDAFAKAAAEAGGYSGFANAWARFVVGVFLIVPIAVLSNSFRGLGRDFYTAQLIRGALVAVTISLMTTAVSLAPLADVYGAFFASPLVATLWARFALKERVGRLEWTALAIGFAGVLLVVKPSGEMNLGLLCALAAGCTFGTFLAVTRWTAASGPPMAQMAGQLTVAVALLSPLAIGEFVSETGEVAAPAAEFLLGSGLASTIANLLSIFAFRAAPAALLAPVVYLQLLSATAVGWWAFGDAPDIWAAVGLVVIALSGVGRFLWRRSP